MSPDSYHYVQEGLTLRATSALPQFELYLVPFLINSMSSLSKAKQQMDSQEAGL